MLAAPAYFSTYEPTRGKTPWVKIGITSNVQQCIMNLKKRCGIFDLSYVYVSHQGTMPWAMLRRIELIFQTEINNFRRRMDCGIDDGNPYQTEHTEWFNVSKEAAIRTVKRWGGLWSKGCTGITMC
jgi:hypothetical protein